MKNKNKSWISRKFDHFANGVAKGTGTPAAFIVAFTVIVIWGISGPVFHFSNTWQLIINTGTTIVTFLMVFIIQQSQNKDTLAIHLKLNELIQATKGADNKAINIEDLTEDQLKIIKEAFSRMESLEHKTDPFEQQSKEEG